MRKEGVWTLASKREPLILLNYKTLVNPRQGFGIKKKNKTKNSKSFLVDPRQMTNPYHTYFGMYFGNILIQDKRVDFSRHCKV